MDPTAIALISIGGTLAVGALSAWVALRVARRHDQVAERRELDDAMAAFLAASIKAVALIQRMPEVDPEFWFHRLSNTIEKAKSAALGPTVGWAQTEARMRKTLGDRPFQVVEDVVDSAARLIVLEPGSELTDAVNHTLDYIGALGVDRSEENLEKWSRIRSELIARIHEARGQRGRPSWRPTAHGAPTGLSPGLLENGADQHDRPPELPPAQTN